MNINNNDKTEIQIKSEFNELNISDKNFNSINNNHENCYNLKDNKPWCKKCVPCFIIEGWTSENNYIDEIIKETIYSAELKYHNGFYPLFLEWIPFNKFKDMKQIGEGGFSKVYSAIWIDGKAKYTKQCDGSWKKKESKPMEVALKRLKGSQNISAKYLNEIKTHWNLYNLKSNSLKFYGITKDSETKEFMLVMQYASQGNLRYVLSNNFNNILWKDKIIYLQETILDLKSLHKLGYCHKDFHSGNILQIYYPGAQSNISYISDFGLSEPSDKQNSDGKICGVLPYVAPEVLNGETYTLSSDIYSFGVIMVELSSGKPPFHKRKNDTSLALEICNGLRPEIGKGTPEIYKNLAYKCMNPNPDQRPTADELHEILEFWYNSTSFRNYQEEKFGYKSKEIKAMFKEADKEIPNISISYERNLDAIYTSGVFTSNDLSKPVNSSIITSDEENHCQDSQLVELNVSNSLQLRDVDNEETSDD